MWFFCQKKKKKQESYIKRRNCHTWLLHFTNEQMKLGSVSARGRGLRNTCSVWAQDLAPPSPGDVMDVTYRLGSEKMRDTPGEGAPMRGNKEEPVVRIHWLNFYVWKNKGFHGFEMNNCQSEHMFSKQSNHFSWIYAWEWNCWYLRV